MAQSTDLEHKVAELESKVKKLEFSALVTIFFVFLLYIFARM